MLARALRTNAGWATSTPRFVRIAASRSSSVRSLSLAACRQKTATVSPVVLQWIDDHPPHLVLSSSTTTNGDSSVEDGGTVDDSDEGNDDDDALEERNEETATKPEPSGLVKDESELERTLRPSEVVKELNQHIVGQQDAKRAVAIALRNRWRRRQLPKDLMKEVTPRNVLMIGPTGCGKTEVARRMAALGDAPFIKVEATKFTEVGYHGRDVDQIIRDLMDVSMALTKKRQTERLREAAKELVEDRILDLLVGSSSSSSSSSKSSKSEDRPTGGGRESFRDMLRNGFLDAQEVELDVPDGAGKDGGGAF
eukprot:scaffold139706_cov42-Attheya_sp.AAC.1